MFLGKVILATLSVIVLGYFKGNMHLVKHFGTTLKNAREFLFMTTVRQFVSTKGDTWEWEETPEVVAALSQLHIHQLKTPNVELPTLI